MGIKLTFEEMNQLQRVSGCVQECAFPHMNILHSS
jgi:hypothetical protein